MSEMEPLNEVKASHNQLLKCYAPDGTVSYVSIDGFSSIQGVIEVLKDTFPLCSSLKSKVDGSAIANDETAAAFGDEGVTMVLS